MRPTPGRCAKHHDFSDHDQRLPVPVGSGSPDQRPKVTTATRYMPAPRPTRSIIPPQFDGLFQYVSAQKVVEFRDITDGLSQTAAFSERVKGIGTLNKTDRRSTQPVILGLERRGHHPPTPRSRTMPRVLPRECSTTCRRCGPDTRPLLRRVGLALVLRLLDVHAI